MNTTSSDLPTYATIQALQVDLAERPETAYRNGLFKAGSMAVPGRKRCAEELCKDILGEGEAVQQPSQELVVASLWDIKERCGEGERNPSLKGLGLGSATARKANFEVRRQTRNAGARHFGTSMRPSIVSSETASQRNITEAAYFSLAQNDMFVSGYGSELGKRGFASEHLYPTKKELRCLDAIAVHGTSVLGGDTSAAKGVGVSLPGASCFPEWPPKIGELEAAKLWCSET
ncbi:unnamed protein product [Symbiodinium microadriaticum]|nr:unnamed protein product [Symbiodinium microadriaticum]